LHFQRREQEIELAADRIQGKFFVQGREIETVGVEMPPGLVA